MSTKAPKDIRSDGTRPGEVALYRLAAAGGELHGPPERIVGRILRITLLWVEVRVRIRDPHPNTSMRKGKSVVVRLPYSCANRRLREWDASHGIVNELISAARRRRGMRPVPDWLARSIEGDAACAEAPYRPGDMVRVVQAIDKDVIDLSSYVGRSGYVIALDYDSGCGQQGPHDPMVTVEFSTRKRLSFWREELECSN